MDRSRCGWVRTARSGVQPPRGRREPVWHWAGSGRSGPNRPMETVRETATPRVGSRRILRSIRDTRTRGRSTAPRGRRTPEPGCPAWRLQRPPCSRVASGEFRFAVPCSRRRRTGRSTVVTRRWTCLARCRARRGIRLASRPAYPKTRLMPGAPSRRIIFPVATTTRVSPDRMNQ